MLKRIFPPHLDNDYRGLRVAIWIFAVIAVMKLALGLGHIFRSDGGAQSVSHIPLDTYPAGAAQNVVAMFARMGLEQLLLAIIFVIVVVRYRSMIPLMFGVAVVGSLGARALALLKPLALASASGATILHQVLLVLGVAGLVLSLVGRRYAKKVESLD